MIRILCFGDSNTWGTIPGTWGGRYDEKTRWTKLLAKNLGKKYEVIEEGFRGRNTGFDDIKYPRGNRNGTVYFPPCVLSHDPIDIIILMLGVNDMKNEFNITPKIAAKNIEQNFIKYLREELAPELNKVPKIIIVAPNVMEEIVPKFKGAAKKSKSFNKEYEQLAKRTGCAFVDNSGLKTGEDGIHLTAESHFDLAQKLAKIIKEGI